ncbi:ATP-dependent DNA helicase [Mycoplasma yeatsii]|uniref:Exodeoxyribonuclease V alpha subunit n=1 Tax=Mycoplasma yeatsii TaxID=51365 RepID=A0ABU0NDI3_9MOLU|nr:AAA family ATPase [Mycoplasma yeatsii]MDQ0567505.1 exodeoxyribonuclease V alpha subunit [Mycoplasma yeatsii]
MSHIGYIKKFISQKKNWFIAEFYILKDKKTIIFERKSNDMLLNVLYSINITEKNSKKECDSYNYQTINDIDLLTQYLSSDLFKIVNEKTAETISRHFVKTSDILNKIIRNKDNFLSIPSVSGYILKNIYKKISNIEEFVPLHLEFINENLDLEIFNELLQFTKPSKENPESIKSSKEMLEFIRNDLYYFNHDKKITSLEDVDKIFLHFTNDKNNIKRIAHYLYEHCNNVLKKTSSTYTQIPAVLYEFNKDENFYIPFDEKEELINQAFNYAFEKKLLVLIEEKLYTKESYEDELNIAHCLSRNNKVNKICSFKINRFIKQIEKEVRKELNNPKFKYDKSQVNALKKFINSKFTVITGGPGTGKTTLIKAVVKLFQKVYKDSEFRIATPTGRAAARIKDSFIESDATTIHKLLEYDFENDEFNKNEYNLLSLDLLIIDESSMVDNNLFSRLLLASQNAKKIVFVGDTEQLPSIDIGNAFEDIINSKKITTVHLSKTHRQKDKDPNEQDKIGIVDLAYMIRNNQFDISKLDNVNDSLKLIFVNDQNKCLEEVERNYINKNGFDEPYAIQIISPTNKNELGVKNINRKIQDTYIDRNNKKVMQINSEFKIAEGDKVMYLKNERNLSNGDIGTIKSLTGKKGPINARFNDKVDEVLDYNQFSNLTLSYACTVHKTQGSEFQKVILALDPENVSPFVSKKLIYTAITRAKQELTIITSQNSLIKSIKQKPPIRNTTLKELIKLMYKKR